MILRRLAVLALLMGVLVAAWPIARWLQPEKPQFTGDTTKQEEVAHPYTPTADCKPEALIRIPAKTDREAKADTCREAKEQHRQRTSELVQQRRSADSADASAILAYEQTRIAAWGMIIGVATLGAAIAAAFFAYEAAKAAIEGLRPWVDIEIKPEWTLSYPDHVVIAAIVTLKNTGATPANRIRLGWSAIPVPPIRDESFVDFEKNAVHQHDMLKSALLPESMFQEQQLWFIPWGENTVANPERGITPLIGVSVVYDLPSGGSGKTIRWFWVGAAPPERTQPKIESRRQRLWRIYVLRADEPDEPLREERDVDPIRDLGHGKGLTRMTAKPAGYGHVQ